MELRHLRSFVVLADERHFTRAAARLHVTQPALSQHLRKLEDAVDLRLVQRTTRSLSLTPAGEVLLARARRIVADVDAAAAELGELRGLRSGRLEVGVTPTPGPFPLAAVLGAFSSQYPEVDLVVHEGLSRDLAVALRDDELQIAFITALDDPAAAKLSATLLAEEALVVIAPPSHRIAGRRSVSIVELRDERFVSFLPGATIRELVARIAGEHGFSPRTSIQVGDVARMRELVASGLGIGVLPRSDALAPGPDVRAIELDGPGFVHQVLVAFRRGHRLGPAAAALERIALETVGPGSAGTRSAS